MTTTTTTTTMIMLLKGAVQDFYNLLTAPRTFFNTHAQQARAQSCVNHVQHIERLSRATCRVSRDVKRHLSYYVGQSEITFIFSLSDWLKPLTDQGGKETRENPE